MSRSVADVVLASADVLFDGSGHVIFSFTTMMIGSYELLISHVEPYGLDIFRTELRCPRNRYVYPYIQLLTRRNNRTMRVPVQIPRIVMHTVPATKREMAENDKLTPDGDFMVVFHTSVKHSETSSIEIITVVITSNQIFDSI
jgi:hypothetical protein